MQIAIEQYYNYLCSDEYLTLLINKRNEVLKEKAYAMSKQTADKRSIAFINDK